MADDSIETMRGKRKWWVLHGPWKRKRKGPMNRRRKTAMMRPIRGDDSAGINEVAVFVNRRRLGPYVTQRLPGYGRSTQVDVRDIRGGRDQPRRANTTVWIRISYPISIETTKMELLPLARSAVLQRRRNLPSFVLQPRRGGKGVPPMNQVAPNVHSFYQGGQKGPTTERRR